MTGADFIAACFWPLVILFAVLLLTVRDPVLVSRTHVIAGVFGALSGILWTIYGQSSLIAVVDVCLFMAVLGIGLVCFGLRELYLFLPIRESKLKACAAVLIGAGLACLFGTILIQDFLLSRIVLEGRVSRVRTVGSRHDRYLADIGGQTVKVTTPVYERLKYLPVVRVEMGRGSGYAFKIEYLAN
jgi:hypothetical protein